jgi:uncharacterized protein
MAALYLDTNVVITLVEETPERVAQVTRALDEAVGPSREYVVSGLVRLECLVKPLAAQDASLVDTYRRFFDPAQVHLVPLSEAVCDQAAHIRAQYGYSTPDALHLAAAIEAGCDVFATSDLALRSFPGVRVVLLTQA